jgi:hypothetical protein
LGIEPHIVFQIEVEILIDEHAYPLIGHEANGVALHQIIESVLFMKKSDAIRDDRMLKTYTPPRGRCFGLWQRREVLVDLAQPDRCG